MSTEFLKPHLITFTGVDNYTSLMNMDALSRHYPEKVEFGILVGGRIDDFRYPDVQSIKVAITGAKKLGIKIAIHLCGVFARSFMNYGDFPTWIDLSGVHRIQVNASQYSDKQLERLKECYMGNSEFPKIILQHRGDFRNLDPTFQYLYDKSGGKGQEIQKFPVRPIHPACGYAGGINPENVREVLKKIPWGTSYWIDMESGVRTNRLFDLTKCRQVCEQVFGPPV